MPVSDFDDMMPHTVTVSEFSSRNAYGDANYGSAVSYTARVIYKDQLIKAKDGSQIMAKGMVWLSGTPTLSTEDLLTLPDGTTPPILSQSLIPDEDGSHHVKVFFG